MPFSAAAVIIIAAVGAVAVATVVVAGPPWMMDHIYRGRALHDARMLYYKYNLGVENTSMIVNYCYFEKIVTYHLR